MPSPANQLAVCLTSFVVFCMGAVLLVVPSGYSAALLLSVAGLGLMLGRWRCLPVLSRQDWILVLLFLFYFAVWALELVRDGQPASHLDKPVRILLAIPALLWLLRYPPGQKAFWGGLAVGAIAVGCWAGWQKLVLDVERAEGFTNTIQFGNLAMLSGMLSLTGLLGWAPKQPRRLAWSLLLGLGVVGGLLGSVFTGSRGGWIGVPFILLVLLRAYSPQVKPAQVLLALGGAAVLGLFLYLVPATGVQERVQTAVQDVQQYVEHANPDTSIGARFEMWKAGFQAMPQHPLLGIGSNGYVAFRDAAIADGRASAVIGDFNHLHNDYIDITVKRGALGLLALLLLYVVPLRMFLRMLGERNAARQPYAAAGAVLCVSYMDFGLTQTFLSHNSGVMVLFFMLVIIWSLARTTGAAPTR